MALAGALEIQMFAGIQRLQKDMNDARGVVNSAARSIESAAAMATRALGALGLGIGLVGLGRMVKGALEAQDALSKLSQKLNVTVETLVGYQHAAGLAGVSNEALTKGFKSLSTQMFDASMGLLESKRNFAALGVEIMKSDGTLKNIDSVMLEVADTFAKMENGTAKTALAVKLFGKAGMDMIPMLNEGSAAIAAMVAEGQRLNPVTTESARQAEIFNDNLSRIVDSAKTAGISLLNNLLPAMAAISKEMAKTATMPGGGFWAALLTGAQTALTGDDALKNLKERARLAQQMAAAQQAIEINTKSFGEEDRRTIAAKEQLGILRGRMETAMAYYKVLQQGAKQEAEADELRNAAKGKITLEDEAANKKAATEAKKLLDADIKGWVAHADAVFAASDEENLELAKLADEHWKNEEKLREEDIKGWIAYADAVFAEADETNLELARINGEYWKKVEDARKKENEERLREMKRVSDETDRMLGDAIMRGFERGEDAAKNFRDTLVNMFKTLVLRPIISAVMSPVTSVVGSAVGGMGMSSAANAAGGAFGATGSLYGSFATSGIGQTLGLSSLEASAGVAGMAPAMTALGTALPWIGGALAIGSALGLFSGGGGPKPSTLAIGGGIGSLGLFPENVSGAGNADANNPAYAAAAAELNKLSTAIQQQLIGKTVTTGPSSDAAAMIQALFSSPDVQPLLKAGTEQLAAQAQALEDQARMLELNNQRRKLEIELMEAQGKESEALAAKRKDELAALDPTLRALQKQIYAAQDLAKAANDASSSVSTLADLLSASQSAVSEQIGQARSMAQTAKAAADSFRQIGTALTAAIDNIRGGGKAGSAGRLDALFGTALTGDSAALSALPQAGQDFLRASLATSRTSLEFARDQAKVVMMLNAAKVVSESAASAQDHIALVADASLAVLEQIADILGQPSPDMAVLREQLAVLGNISNLSDSQLAALVASGGIESNSLTALVTGNAMTVSLLQQLVEMQGAANMAAYDAKFQEAVGTIWASVQASGGTLADFDSQFAAWKASNPMPSYAVGTSFVPNTGPAMLHQGERVMTAAANDELVTEIRRLNDKIDRMRSDTKKSADTLEAVANGQLSFSTEAA